jgi:hypothetical protein
LRGLGGDGERGSAARCREGAAAAAAAAEF